jgi:hypothetical protein
MKKLYTLLALIATTVIFAQAPQGFNYQATVRNSAGALIVNQNVYFKFNVMLNSATSVPVFTETHYVPTDDLGQVNLVIGQGTATTGTFSTINWGTGNYYLGIELNTGAGYVAMGTTQLLSVPYALYANSSGNAQTPTPNLASVLAVNNSANNTKITNLANPTDAQDAVTKQYVDSKIPNGTNVGDNLTWNGTNWVVTSANTTTQLPQLTTTLATGITPFEATSGGTIIGDGGFSIISKGVAWSTSPNPTINDNFTNNGSGASTFQSVLNNLLPGTSYYYRAYATNTVGTGYGMSFTYSYPFINAPIPSINQSNVISIFSDAYTNVPVIYYNGYWAPWQTTESNNFAVLGDNVLNYTNFNFVGIEFSNPTVNANSMTHIHLDAFIPGPIAPGRQLIVQVRDFGANGVFGGGDDTQHSTTFTASTSTPIVSQNWISIEIPFSAMPGLVSRSHLAQIILEGGDGSNLFIDNIYFHN